MTGRCTPFHVAAIVLTPYRLSARIGRLELWERVGDRPRGSRAVAFLLRWRRRPKAAWTGAWA